MDNTSKVLFIIFGLISVGSLILSIIPYFKKDNFQAPSKNFCMPCAANPNGTSTYTNTDGNSVPCETIEDWFNSDEGMNSLKIPLVKLGANFNGGKFNIDGNSETTTRLQTSRNVGGVPFDGTADIDLPGVNKTGTMGTTGTAQHAINAQSANCAITVNQWGNNTEEDSTWGVCNRGGYNGSCMIYGNSQSCPYTKPIPDVKIPGRPPEGSDD
jgi:hypothetical protein